VEERELLMNTEKLKKYFLRKLQSGKLLLLLGFGGLSLWQHGSNLVRNFLVLDLDLFQDGVNLGLVVAVHLKFKNSLN